MTNISRRTTLGLLAGAAVAGAALPAMAQGVSGRKLIFVFLRGALDGLSALIPDDGALEGVRPTIMPERAERFDLGNGFRLHPSLPEINSLYQAQDAAFLHATAAPYRIRSHFDAQDLFETMGRAENRDGWLNRAVQATGGQGLAVGHSLPLAMQGDGTAYNWSPPAFGAAPESVLERLEMLYETDPQFSEALSMARGGTMMGMDAGGSARRFGRSYVEVMQLTGRLMGKADSPGICMVSLGGWDSHAGQARDLQNRFEALDLSIAALKAEMGSEWANTCLVMCSEFGRTVAENGTRGTDHGTGGLVMLLGGAVAGGKVHGDWPGVRRNQLFEGRDLAPANEMTGVLKGVLRDHLGIDRNVLNTRVMTDASRPVDGLISL